MKELISHLLKQVAAILEYVIAFMLAIGIILLCLRMVCSLQYIPNLNTYPNYDDLLEVCFNLIIGVELIRMMYSHSPSTVFEVLLFAIARHIIMDHTSIYSSLIGVCSIAVWKNFKNSGNSCYTLAAKHVILHISDRLPVRVAIVRL